MTGVKKLRCAVYTRKSSEEGLEQDYNSLHAQRDACEAFIRSQKHEGWQLVPTAYDDGGISGGTMERPGLQQLMADIRNRRIDVIVVYKVDRLTRSLADFARLVELFDQYGVSFVSVTQQFNTTSSMGRLTLNVLLSFAQFEREVTGERIRDKIAASKQKGMWMGGPVPLGYEVKERKLLVKEPDAQKLRQIFELYLEQGCVRLLQRHLKENGIYSASGAVFSRGALYKILSNPVFMGQIRHKDMCYPGQHERIIDLELWEKVQKQLAGNRIGKKGQHTKTESALLKGKLYDADGDKMVIMHASKRGRRYRYYVSQRLTKGVAAENPTGSRLPAAEVDRIVLSGMRKLLSDREAMIKLLEQAGMSAELWHDVLYTLTAMDAESFIQEYLLRAEVHPDQLKLTFSLATLLPPEYEQMQITHHLPLGMKRRGVEMRMVIAREEEVRMDNTLIRTLAKAHYWWQELLTGKVKTAADLARRENLDKGSLSRILELAFLAPDIVECVLQGRQPAGLTTQHLLRGIKLPYDWELQRKILAKLS